MPDPKPISDEPPRKNVGVEEPSVDVSDSKNILDKPPRSNEEVKGDVPNSNLVSDDPLHDDVDDEVGC